MSKYEVGKVLLVLYKNCGWNWCIFSITYPSLAWKHLNSKAFMVCNHKAAIAQLAKRLDSLQLGVLQLKFKHNEHVSSTYCIMENIQQVKVKTQKNEDEVDALWMQIKELQARVNGLLLSMDDSTISCNLNAINCLDLNEHAHDSISYTTSTNHNTVNFSNVNEHAQNLCRFIVMRNYIINL